MSRVALNGYVFFKVFAPISREPQLHRLLTTQRTRTKLVLTEGMIREYRQIAREEDKMPRLSDLEVVGCIQRARDTCQLVTRAGEEPDDIPGLGSHHRCIVLQAIAAHATHLVTNRREWLELGNHLSQHHGLKALRPHEFATDIMR